MGCDTFCTQPVQPVPWNLQLLYLHNSPTAIQPHHDAINTQVFALVPLRSELYTKSAWSFKAPGRALIGRSHGWCFGKWSHESHEVQVHSDIKRLWPHRLFVQSSILGLHALWGSKRVYIGLTWASRFLCLPARIRCMGSIRKNLARLLRSISHPLLLDGPSQMTQLPSINIHGDILYQIDPNPTTPEILGFRYKVGGFLAPLAEELLRERQWVWRSTDGTWHNMLWCASYSHPICSIRIFQWETPPSLVFWPLQVATLHRRLYLSHLSGDPNGCISFRRGWQVVSSSAKSGHSEVGELTFLQNHAKSLLGIHSRFGHSILMSSFLVVPTSICLHGPSEALLRQPKHLIPSNNRRCESNASGHCSFNCIQLNDA